MATAAPQPRPERLPYFISTQVTEARRYFLDLAPKPSSRLVVVCGGCERVQPDYLVERDTFPGSVHEPIVPTIRPDYSLSIPDAAKDEPGNSAFARRWDASKRGRSKTRVC